MIMYLRDSSIRKMPAMEAGVVTGPTAPMEKLLKAAELGVGNTGKLPGVPGQPV